MWARECDVAENLNGIIFCKCTRVKVLIAVAAIKSLQSNAALARPKLLQGAGFTHRKGNGARTGFLGRRRARHALRRSTSKRINDQFDARGNSQLVEDSEQVVFDGVFRQSQML